MRRFRDGDGVETTVVVNGARAPLVFESGAPVSAPGFGSGLKRVTIPSLDGAILTRDQTRRAAAPGSQHVGGGLTALWRVRP